MTRPALARREPAQVTALTAVIIIALVGAVGLVVDVGMLWLSQRELQKTADSAALAGVTLMPDTDAAEQQAAWYADQNLGVARQLCRAEPVVDSTPGQLTMPGGAAYTLTTTVHCPAGFLFGQVVSSSGHGGACDGTECADLSTVPNDCNCVRASATAVIGSNRSPGCPAPFAVADINQGITANGFPLFWGDSGATWQDMARNGSGYSFGQLTELRVDSSGASNSDLHAISVTDRGNGGPNGYEAELANQCAVAPNILPGDPVYTQPGDPSRPTYRGLLLRGLVPCTGSDQPPLCTDLNYPAPHPPYRLACPDNPLDLDSSDHSGVLNPDGSPRRLSLCLTQVYVVVPQAFDLGNGRFQIPHVEGFAEFFITGCTPPPTGNPDRCGSVSGMFVRGAPTLGELGAYDPFGTIIIRLIR